MVFSSLEFSARTACVTADSQTILSCFYITYKQTSLNRWWDVLTPERIFPIQSHCQRKREDQVVLSLVYQFRYPQQSSLHQIHVTNTILDWQRHQRKIDQNSIIGRNVRSFYQRHQLCVCFFMVASRIMVLENKQKYSTWHRQPLRFLLNWEAPLRCQNISSAV